MGEDIGMGADGADYTATSGTVTFAAGETRAEVNCRRYSRQRVQKLASVGISLPPLVDESAQ